MLIERGLRRAVETRRTRAARGPAVLRSAVVHGRHRRRRIDERERDERSTSERERRAPLVRRTARHLRLLARVLRAAPRTHFNRLI